MAQDNGDNRPTIEQLLKDPRYKEEKDFLWAAFAAFRTEENAAADAARASRKPNSFLEGLLGPWAPR